MPKVYNPKIPVDLFSGLKNLSNSWLPLLFAICLFSCKKEAPPLTRLHPEKPIINTRPATHVNVDSVMLNGEVLEVGVLNSEFGFVLSTNPNPTLENAQVFRLGTIKKTGDFTAIANQLEAHQQYYYRLFAKTNQEVQYSRLINFVTDSLAVFSVSGSDLFKGSRGNIIDIAGWNFSSVLSENTVTFNGKLASTFSFYKDFLNQTHLLVYLPMDLPTGLVPVVVSRAGQTVTANQLFRVLPGTWRQISSLEPGRLGASAFSLNDKAYVGLGLNGLTATLDFWEYNPLTDAWKQKSSYPGTMSIYGIGVAVGQKGYAGLGRQQEFWEYDPSTNHWTRKADFPALPGDAANAFTIGSKAYVGLGLVNDNFNYGYKKDLWQYDPAANIWIRKADFPGQARQGAISFVIAGKAYIGTGYNGGDNFKDFWQYDPTTNTWTRKADFPGSGRAFGQGFTLNNRGYLVGGREDVFHGGKRGFWQYDPGIDAWSEIADFDSGMRSGAVCFTVGNHAYLGTGDNGTNADFWEFTPEP